MPKRNGASSKLSPLLTVQKVAEICDVAERTVYRWIGSGELSAHYFNRLVRIASDDLDDFLRRHRGQR